MISLDRLLVFQRINIHQPGNIQKVFRRMSAEIRSFFKPRISHSAFDKAGCRQIKKYGLFQRKNCSFSDHGKEHFLQLLIFFEGSAGYSCNCFASWLFNASHGHAGVFCFQHNHNSLRREGTLQSVRNLYCEAFLDLRSSGINLYRTCQRENPVTFPSGI